MGSVSVYAGDCEGIFPGGVVTRENTASVKLINKSKEEEYQFQNSKKRFMREAEILARLSDIPEIVRAIDCFFANHTAYLVMEYVQGITLKQYVKEQGGRLMSEEAFGLLRPVMKALGRVHKLGIVHRDISPDNIMLLSHGEVKLLDFGAVKDVGEEAQIDKELTRPTEAILKEGYAPIEQYQTKGGLGPWTDVYALCATLFYCMTGEVPPDALERLLGKEEISFSGYGVKITVEKEQVLCHGMALRSKDRISSMDELYKELFGVSADVSEEQILFVLTKKKGYILAGMIVACIILCAGTFFALNYNGKVRGWIGTVFANGTYSGKCGENVYWKFEPYTKTLTLSGTGETYYYCQDDEARDLDLLSSDGITEEWIHEEHADFCRYADNIEEIVIEDGVTAINQRLFADLTSLKKVDLGSIEELGSRGGSCFEGSSLKTVDLPDTLKVMDEWALAFCEQLETVSIPNSVTKVGAHCFAGSPNLKIVTILPDTVKMIGQYAFIWCSRLDRITITNGSAGIEKGCLGGCESLKSVIFGKKANPAEDLLGSVVMSIARPSLTGEGTEKSGSLYILVHCSNKRSCVEGMSFLFLFILWIMWNGKITSEIAVLGIIICAAL